MTVSSVSCFRIRLFSLNWLWPCVPMAQCVTYSRDAKCWRLVSLLSNTHCSSSSPTTEHNGKRCFVHRIRKMDKWICRMKNTNYSMYEDRMTVTIYIISALKMDKNLLLVSPVFSLVVSSTVNMGLASTLSVFFHHPKDNSHLLTHYADLVTLLCEVTSNITFYSFNSAVCRCMFRPFYLPS